MNMERKEWQWDQGHGESARDFGEGSFKAIEGGQLGYQLGDLQQEECRKEKRSEKYVGEKLRKLLSFWI